MKPLGFEWATLPVLRTDASEKSRVVSVDPNPATVGNRESYGVSTAWHENIDRR